MQQILIEDAPTLWKLLNGVLCLYKPAGESVFRVRRSLLGKLSRELCELKCRDPSPYVSVEGDTTQPMAVSVTPSYADHPLVVGPRYIEDDFRCTWATFLGFNTSGVFVLGLNKGTSLAYKIHGKHPMRTYRLKGILGYTTDNLFKTGKVVERSSFNHVKLPHLENILACVQATHQRNVFEICGVDPQSQEAYELAVSGLVRPANSKIPIIYSCKCVEFNLPEFTIEVQCINEYEAFLMALIHSIGLKLRSAATCTAIHCIRHSFFNLDSALLKKHWTLQNVMKNLVDNRKLIKQQKEISQLIKNIKGEV
uniref:Putative pseudouridine synthase n=1 Tax=Triatoma dimidiata TaxID=72491 RepID=A0A0V0GD68_TRIDM